MVCLYVYNLLLKGHLTAQKFLYEHKPQVTIFKVDILIGASMVP